MSFFNGTVLKKIIQARHGDGVFRPILSIGGSAAAPYCPTSLMMAKGSIREVQSKSIIGCVCTTPATRGAMAAGSAVNAWLSVRMECIFKSAVWFLPHLLVTRSIFVTLRWFPAKTKAIGWCWGHNRKADMERCCFIHLPTGANGLLPE